MDASAERLIKAFSAFDADKSGKVSTEAMTQILTTLGNPLTQMEMNEFLQDADTEGWIDYQRFVTQVIFGPLS